MSKNTIRTDKTWFCDNYGRKLLLRGVNLGGSSKMPYTPYAVSHIKEGFYKTDTISFVGRPFPLAEAEQHFKRLQLWGLHTIRFLVTWEAIEHEGPGIYDEAYLDYIYQIVKKANDYDINVFIDPHQDVWSRFTGGDGAPLWTLEKVGLVAQNFDRAGVSFAHNILGDPYPRMEWYTNNFKFAAGTMFTLFWGGDRFAPKTLIDGIPVQEYLQSHFIKAMQQVVKKLVSLPNVIGYETMNEPAEGFIGAEDIRTWIGVYGNGYTPNLWQSLQLASGFPQEVALWEYTPDNGIQLRPEKILKNDEGIKVWKTGYADIWQENGVWKVDTDGKPKLLDPSYFKLPEDGFLEDHFKPFAERYIEAIRVHDSKAIIFIEPPIGMPPPHWKEKRPDNVADASHWYDIHALFSKVYNPTFTINHFKGERFQGKNAVEQSFVDQLSEIKTNTQSRMGAVPTLIGEFGLQMDINNAEAYKTGDFTTQIIALDTYFRAMEKNLLHYTLWNYTADNSNERGDQWNGEDLSIFSEDQRKNPKDPHSGSRALEAIARPYPRKTAGELLNYSFHLEKKEFKMSFKSDPTIEVPTEIFVPNFQFPEYEITLSKGHYEIQKKKQRILIYTSKFSEIINVKITAT